MFARETVVVGRWLYCIAVYISLLITSINMGDIRYRNGLLILAWLLFLMVIPIANMVWTKKFGILGLLISLWLMIHSGFWFVAIRLHNFLWPTWFV